jgi:hypothetical protein
VHPICSRWELALGFAFVGLLTLIFFGPILAGKMLSNVPSAQQISAPWQAGRPLYLFPQADQAFLVYPFTILETHAFRAGIIPLWNPNNLGGIPLLANGQSGVLYPLRILLSLAVSASVNHDLFVLVHIFAAGFFMFLLLKEFRLHVLAALLGAAGWMYASWNSGLMQVEVILPVLAWLPAALLLIHRGARTRSWCTAALAGIPLGLMALGGQLEQVAVGFAVCGLYSAALALVPPRPRRSRWRLDRGRLADPLLTIGIGVSLAAATLLPTLENASQGGREAASYASFVHAHTIPVAEFKYVLSGGPPTGLTLLFGGVFVGVVPLLLAFVGCFRRRPGAGLGRSLAIATFLFAIGAPVVTWLAYHFVPGMSRLSSTGYLLWLFDLGVLVLAALGLDALLDWSASLARRISVVHLDAARWVTGTAMMLAVVAVGVTAWQVVDYANYVNPPFMPRQSKLLFPTTPAISTVETDRSHRSPEEPQRLMGFDAVIADESNVFSLEDADGYDSVVSNRVRSLWDVVAGLSVNAAIERQHRIVEAGFKSGSSATYLTHFEPAGTRFALLGRVGVTTVIASPADALELAAHPPSVALRQIYVGTDATVYDVGGSAPRGWVVHEADVVANASDALHRFADPAFDYRARMVVEPDQSLGMTGKVNDRGSGRGGAAARDALSTNGTSFSVTTKSPGWLVMADMYAPGWRVTVNGRDATLLRADYTLRAVAVPGGRSHVVLTYRPPGFVPGLLISAVALLALVLIGLLALRARRHRTLAAADPTRRPAGRVPSRRRQRDRR